MDSMVNKRVQSHGLLAILLVTRSRPGPKLLYHYPANPGSNGHSCAAVDCSRSDVSDDDSNDSGTETRPTSAAAPEDDLANSRLEDIVRDARPQLFGFSIDSLEKLLAPDQWANRGKFEMSVDGLTFVGHPVHANKDGLWSDAHLAPTGESRLDASTETLKKGPDAHINGNEHRDEHGISIALTAPSVGPPQTRDFTHVADSFESQQGLSLGTSVNSASSMSEAIRDRMTMFHVVFVFPTGRLNVLELHRHVAKKLSKALNYCQKQNGYVATESRKLLALRARTKLEDGESPSMIKDWSAHSELAWALKETYEQISSGQIANLRINGMEMSIQLPTKSNELAEQDQSQPQPHHTLLLLEDKDKLLAELTNTDAPLLAYFIREHTPTKSLQKHALRLSVPIEDILFLSQHLLRWRKARLITPLRPGNVYVVSSTADLKAIPSRAQFYAKTFTALPTLAQMLKILSGRPIKYVMLIPSRDHREPYMNLLACLVRDGFVVQLKTYGWLSGVSGERLLLRPPDRTIAQPYASPANLLSPHLRPVEDDSISVSSERTAFQRSSTPVMGNGADEAGAGRVIILDPAHMSPDEEALAEKIRASIWDAEIRAFFPTLQSYLTGEDALEDISAREGVKRAFVERCLDILEQDRHLVTFRRT